MSVRKLSPELQQIAERELREDPSRVHCYLQLMRDWVATQRHLNVRPEDQWLLLFLRGCKYNINKTKQKIETFYTMRTLAPEFFSNRDPFRPEIQELLDLGVCVPLPKSLDNHPVLLIRYKGINTSRNHMVDIIKVIIMSMDILLNENDNFVILGHKTIQDLSDASLMHMLQTSPNYAKKAYACFQDAFPIRLNVVYFVDPPSFVRYVYVCFNSFITNKLKRRMKVQSISEVDTLWDDIPRSVLPTEYGGVDGSVEDMAAEWKDKVESYRDWFLDDEKYRSDESKRRKKPARSLWGMIFGN